MLRHLGQRVLETSRESSCFLLKLDLSSLLAAAQQRRVVPSIL